MSPKVGTVTPPENGDWSHRSTMAKSQLDLERQASISREAENRKHGEELSHEEMREFLGNVEQRDLSEIHPNHDKKDLSDKYRDKFWKYWGPETKARAIELYKQRSEGDA